MPTTNGQNCQRGFNYHPCHLVTLDQETKIVILQLELTHNPIPNTEQLNMQYTENYVMSLVARTNIKMNIASNSETATS